MPRHWPTRAAAGREVGLRDVSEAASAACDELLAQLDHANRDSDELRWALAQALAHVDSLEGRLEACSGTSGGKVGGGATESKWGADEATGATVHRGVACA